MQAYFTRGTLPPEGATCTQEQTPFTQPQIEVAELEGDSVDDDHPEAYYFGDAESDGLGRLAGLLANARQRGYLAFSG